VTNAGAPMATAVGAVALPSGVAGAAAGVAFSQAGCDVFAVGSSTAAGVKRVSAADVEVRFRVVGAEEE
jgi:hypothetical protein